MPLTFVNCSDDAEWAAYIEQTPILQTCQHRLMGKHWLPVQVPIEGPAPLKVIVMGGVGCGKTTLMKNLGLPKVPAWEPIGEWLNYGGHFLFGLKLANGTNDIVRSQLAVFTATKIRMDDSELVAMERSFFEAINVFAHVGGNAGEPNETELEVMIYSFLCEMVYAANTFNLHAIYLKCDPQVQFERMTKRGTDLDKTISLDYVTEISDKHDTYVLDPKQSIVVHVVDTTSITPDLVLTQTKDILRALIDDPNNIVPPQFDKLVFDH